MCFKLIGPHISVLRQINALFILEPCLLEARFNIIHPCRPLAWFVLFIYVTKILYTSLISSMLPTCHIYFDLIDFLALISRAKEYKL
jgi:hypothetical protein